MCIYVSICVYLCLYASICVYMCLYVSICVYLCLYVPIYVYLYLSVYIRVYLCLSVYLSICLNVYMSICLSVSIICGPAWWLALLHIKVGNVETNPCPTTTHKQFWIFNVCHKQIHDWKQISIRCNRIEHWVYLRCACIRLAQYTDTLTSHLHK